MAGTASSGASRLSMAIAACLTFGALLPAAGFQSMVTQLAGSRGPRRRPAGRAPVAPPGRVRPLGAWAYSSIKTMPYDLTLDSEAARQEDLKKLKETLQDILVPTVLAIIGCTVAYRPMALFFRSILGTSELTMLAGDQAFFIENFRGLNAMLFSILTGHFYSAMYEQNVQIYMALYSEVTEAKSLLEQTSLVCAGRKMYGQVLGAMKRYIDNDLRRIDFPPALLLSNRPSDDPLEKILYLTSVGEPSAVYDTVRSLRQARAQRLGAIQRKMPKLQLWLLYFLALLETLSYPLLGANSPPPLIGGGFFQFSVQAVLFGCLGGALTMTLKVMEEMWRHTGGAYNVDSTLSVMVRGLEAETNARITAFKSRNPETAASPA